VAQHLRSKSRHDQVSVEEAFVKAHEILGVDPTSGNVARDVSRTRRRLLAEIELSSDGVVAVGDHLIDRQTVTQIADALATPDNIDALARLHNDEPLREFLISADPTWAGRVREQDYYSSDAFEQWILPALTLATRHALAETWNEDDEQNFQRVFRLGTHVPSVTGEIEAFLDSQLGHLQHRLDELEEGERDPEADTLPLLLREHVSVGCLNTLSDTFASYRSTFYRTIREIALTCHNDFDCSIAALEVFRIAEPITVDPSEDEQRTDDLETIRNIADRARLETEHQAEFQKLQAACNKIERLSPDKAIAKAHKLPSWIPVKVIRGLPTDLQNQAGDHVAGAFRSLATKVWNERQAVATSRQLLQTASELPLTDEGKQLIEASRQRLEEVWFNGLKERLKTVGESLSEACKKAVEVARSPGQDVNKEAMNNALRKFMEVLTPPELSLAYRHGLSDQTDALLKILTIFAPLGSSTTCLLAAQWLEPLAEVSENARHTLDTLRRERRKKILIAFSPLLIIGALLLFALLFSG
jgi:hypothetical protein